MELTDIGQQCKDRVRPTIDRARRFCGAREGARLGKVHAFKPSALESLEDRVVLSRMTIGPAVASARANAVSPAAIRQAFQTFISSYKAEVQGAIQNLRASSSLSELNAALKDWVNSNIDVYATKVGALGKVTGGVAGVTIANDPSGLSQLQAAAQSAADSAPTTLPPGVSFASVKHTAIAGINRSESRSLRMFSEAEKIVISLARG
jgi:hypothetical protein